MRYKYPKYIKEKIKEMEGIIKMAYHEGVANGLKQAMNTMNKKKI